MPQDTIPELAADHHKAIDWPRVKRALRLQHPLRTAATIATGTALGPWWTGHAALPLTGLYGPGAAIGATFMAGVYGTAIVTSRRVRPLIRRAVAIALVAAVTGTLYAAPVRHLIAAWIMEN